MLENRVTLRNATPEDMEFLASLYSNTRQQEVAAWGWTQAQQEIFLRMQFDAQCRSYRAGFPDAIDHIVCLDGVAVGRMLLSHETAGLHLVDIALFEACKNQGVGTGLLRRLLRDCKAQGTPVRLQVMQGNRAIRLYRRLGFIETSSDPMYVQMEWTPLSSQERS